MDFSEFTTKKYGDFGSAVNKLRPNSLLSPASEPAEAPPEPANTPPPEKPARPPNMLDNLDLSKLIPAHLRALAIYLSEVLKLPSQARLITTQIDAFEKERAVFETLLRQNPDVKDIQKPYHREVFDDTIDRACSAYRPIFNLINATTLSPNAIVSQLRATHAELNKTELSPLRKYNAHLAELANRKNPFTLTAETDLKILQTMSPTDKKPLK